MRLRRLILQRYGFFTDIQLDLAPDVHLHVVYGLNEAGKSTMLAALGDFLFGFPSRTSFAYVHDQRHLRVGAELQAADGRTQVFFRRKGNKDTLRDGDDIPLPESALHPFVGTANRELFERMFGLNANSLREGGRDILRGGGSIGASLFQAGTGLHGISALVEELRSDAGKLYGDRRGTRLFYEALERYQKARRDRDERLITATEYEEKRLRLATVEAERADLRSRAKKLGMERTKADRIRRTAPILRALSLNRVERADLGELPSLPDDAERRRQEAVLNQATASSDLVREEHRVNELTKDLAAIPEGTPVLDAATEIKSLNRKYPHAISARDDRPDQETAAAAAWQEMLAAKRELGLSFEPDQMASRIPTDLDLNKIRRLSQKRAALNQSLVERKRSLAVASKAYEEAKAAFEDTAPVPDTLLLRRVVEAVKVEGRLDAELETVEAKLAQVRCTLGRALSALPLWAGNAGELASAPVPDATTIQRFGESFRTAATRIDDARAGLASLDAQDADDKARLVVLARGEDVPTAGAVASVRVRRDAAWRLIRRQYVEWGPEPTEKELAEVAAMAALPDSFQSLISEADKLADQRAKEGQRVLDYEHTQARMAIRPTEREKARDQVAEAEDALQAISAAWKERWRAARIQPETPREMEAWLRQRLEVLRDLKDCQEAETSAQRLRQRRTAAVASLAREFPEIAEANREHLVNLLAACEAFCERQEAARRAREQQEKDLNRRADELPGLRAALDEALADDAAWRIAWAEALSALHVSADTSSEDAEIAIALWERIKAGLARWGDARGRIQQMTTAIDAFHATVSALVRRIAPELAERDAFGAFAALLERLRQEEDSAASRQRIATALERTGAARDDAKKRLHQAETALTVLRELARIDSDGDLEAAIARFQRGIYLDSNFIQLESDLARESDGHTLEDLAAESEAADTDAIKSRIDEIEQELTEIGETTERLTAEHTTLQSELAAMERGQGAAGAAQDMENAIAEARMVAEHYAELRIATVLLPAAIERYRRKHEGPMLRRASGHFRDLTHGRYERLATDSDGTDNLVLIACQADGTECRVEALSEGARDQLYLALRTAAIEDFAKQAPPLPFVADDLLINFDGPRAEAAVDLLTRLGATTQTILFTHHEHIAVLAERRSGHGVQVCRIKAR